MNIQKLHISPSTPLKAAAAALILLAIAVSLTAYPLPAQAQTSTDATLSALTVSPRGHHRVRVRPHHLQCRRRQHRDRGHHHPDGHQTATPIVTYNTTDADLLAPGHQVNLSAGRNFILLTVTAEDTTTKAEYTVFIGRGVTTDYGWRTPSDDLNGLVAAGNTDPYGMWGNSSTIWVIDLDDTFVYAYNRDGSRDTAKDFNLPRQQCPTTRSLVQRDHRLDSRQRRRQALRLPSIQTEDNQPTSEFNLATSTMPNHEEPGPTAPPCGWQ